MAPWHEARETPVEEGSDDALLPHSEEEQASRRGGGRHWSRTALLALVAGCAGAALVLARLGSGLARRPLRYQAVDSLEVKAEAMEAQCGTVDHDTDYVLSFADQEAWGMSLDHIPHPDMCCQMCQGVPECKSWTWVKDAGLDGCPSQCWLKGGTPEKKVAKHGIVSGLAPPRPELDLHEVPKAPEKAPTGGNLFCFSLMVPFGCNKGTCPDISAEGYKPSGHEFELIQTQWDLNTAIFACDSYAVYSNRTVTVGKGLKTIPVDVDLTVAFGGDSYTALNTWIFIAVWKKVIDEGRHETADWIAKVDPDAVFFPDRLRPILAQHEGAGYINNCKFGLHGPLEVLSSKAMRVLEADYKSSWDKKAPAKCVKELDFGLWGEDFFLSKCLRDVHNLAPPLEPMLMCEAHCDCDEWYWCQTGGDRVTYHPFKRPDMYRQCLANALAAP